MVTPGYGRHVSQKEGRDSFSILVIPPTINQYSMLFGVFVFVQHSELIDYTPELRSYFRKTQSLTRGKGSLVREQVFSAPVQLPFFLSSLANKT
jgi:hypothetical protein